MCVVSNIYILGRETAATYGALLDARSPAALDNVPPYAATSSVLDLLPPYRRLRGILGEPAELIIPLHFPIHCESFMNN